MLKSVFALSLALAAAVAADAPVVNRVFVESPYNAGVIFEYAGAAMPEDRPLAEGAVACLTAELKSTGLFTDVRISLKPVDEGRKVDVNIVPTWLQQWESLTVGEIVLDDFAGIDESQLRACLLARGLAPGASLAGRSVQRIRADVLEAAQDVFKTDTKKADDVAERLSDISVRPRLLASGKVRLAISAGPRPLCRQQVAN